MKITHKHLQTAVLALGGFLILFTVLNGIFKFDLDEKLMNDISTFVTIGALSIFLWSRSLRKQEEAAEKAKQDDAVAVNTEGTD